MNQYEAYTLSILASGPHSGTVSFENHKKPMKTKKKIRQPLSSRRHSRRYLAVRRTNLDHVGFY